MTSTTDVVKPVEDIDDNSDNSGDDYVMNTVTEISKKSKRWQDWNNAISKPDEDEENIILGDGTSFMFTEPKKEKQKNLKSLPLFQTPSHLYVEYEQAIDSAMQEVRKLKSSIRDDDWEDHNADQLVASLFALSRSCVQAAEMFVKRQEYESGESIDDESIEPDLNEPDPYIEQLPILKHVISQFQDAKRIHQELKESAVNRQNDIKYKYGIYMVPTLHPLHEKHDNEAMSEVDLHYTDYLSIETFILKGLKCATHPFGKALVNYLEYFNATFSVEKVDFADKKALTTMNNSVIQFVESLAEGVIRRYQYLDLKRWEVEVTRSIHNCVMDTLYRSILPIYLYHYQKLDDDLDKKISVLSKYKDDPVLLGVPKRLCSVLIEDIQKESEVLDEHDDYFASLKYLKELPCLTNVDHKLHNLVQALNILCTSVESFYFEHIKTSVTLSADDVLSLFVYAIIVSDVPCIYSQCRFIDHFIVDEASLGEEGYSLATFDTAISAIRSIDETKISKIQ